MSNKRDSRVILEETAWRIYEFLLSPLYRGLHNYWLPSRKRTIIILTRHRWYFETSTLNSNIMIIQWKKNMMSNKFGGTCRRILVNSAVQNTLSFVIFLDLLIQVCFSLKFRQQGFSSAQLGSLSSSFPNATFVFCVMVCMSKRIGFSLISPQHTMTTVVVYNDTWWS